MHPTAIFRVAFAGLVLAASGRTFAQFPAVSFNETAAEFAGRADLDGNGLPDVVVIDKISGSIRVSYQTAAGVFAWDEPKASGIDGVTGVTAGRLLSLSRDALAVTSPAANRVNVISLSPGVSVVPQSVFITPVGPKTVVAANLAGTIPVDDFWVGSALNSAPQTGSFDQFVNNPAGSFAFNANRQISTGSFDGANPVVVKTGLAGTFAYLEHPAAGDTLRIISPGEAGAPVRLTLAALPADSSYLIAPFGGSALANILTWHTGDFGFASRRVAEAVPGTFTLAPKVSFAMPFGIGQLLLVPTSATAVKLFAISADGLAAAYFDFDGTTLSAPIETLLAPPGESFTGGVALPGFAGFHLLRGTAGDGRSNVARYMKWSSSSGKFADVGGALFDKIGKRSGSGNVMIFAGEPFVSPDAKLIARLNARDWSSGVPPNPPAALSLTGEVFDSITAGLHSPAAVNLGAPPAGATHVLLNQYRPYLGFFSLARAEGTSIGDPAIMPESGRFARTIQISFTAPAGMTVKFRPSGGTWTTYAAPGPQPGTSPGDPAYEAWWSNFRPLLFFKDTTIEYYGQVGAKRFTIRSAAFQFTTTPGNLSALNDGVPDYVKIGLHYNPFLPPPALKAGEMGGFPTRLLGGPGKVTNPRALAASAFDLYVRPLSLNGYSAAVVPSLLAGSPLPGGSQAAGNLVSAFDAGGALLATSDETNPPTATAPGLRIWNPPFAEPSARLSGLSGDGNGGFAVLATAPNFAIGGTLPPDPYPKSAGREIVAIMPVPARAADPYQGSYGGGTDAAEADAWIAGAVAYRNSKGVPSEARTIDSLDTMATLVFERWLLSLFLQRGILPPTFAPPAPDATNPPAANPNFLSLTAFRPGEAAHAIAATPAGAVFPTAAQIRDIGNSPPPVAAYRLSGVIAVIQDALRNSADPDIANLRAVVTDVYRISSRRGNESPGAFELPLDALRRFLATGAVPPGYGNKPLVPNPTAVALPGAPYSTLTDLQFTSAMVGMGKILQQVQARPSADFDLTVRSDSVMPGCTLMDQTYGGNTVSLLDYDGKPFAFPYGFDVTPGTHLRVTAYTDPPAGPCGPQIEVVDLAGIAAAEVTSVPTITPLSGDNLLPDDWEMFFFGHTGIDPFATATGSDLSYLQIYLEGRDPLNPASYAGLQALLTSLPQLFITPIPGGSGHKLSFKLPAQFADRFTFQMQTTNTLGGFTVTPDAIIQTQPGVFEVTPPASGLPKRFWRIGFALK